MGLLRRIKACSEVLGHTTTQPGKAVFVQKDRVRGSIFNERRARRPRVADPRPQCGRGGGVTTARPELVRSDGTVRRRTPKDASTTDTTHLSRALVPDPRRPATPPRTIVAGGISSAQLARSGRARAVFHVPNHTNFLHPRTPGCYFFLCRHLSGCIPISKHAAR